MASNSTTVAATATTPATPVPTTSLVGSRDKNVRWYKPTLETLSLATRNLLEAYSKIPEDQVIPHIYEVVCA